MRKHRDILLLLAIVIMTGAVTVSAAETERDATAIKKKAAKSVTVSPTETEAVSTTAIIAPEPVTVPTSPTAGEEINWSVIGSGGALGASTNWIVVGTVGQTAVGSATSTNYIGLHGFWQSFEAAEDCCEGRVGDANWLGTYPNEVTIADIMTLVTAKYVSILPCEQNLPCLTEADVNQSGGANPACKDVTIADILSLVDHLFIAGPTNAPLKSCL
jgi:hypothetical protein